MRRHSAVRAIALLMLACACSPTGSSSGAGSSVLPEGVKLNRAVSTPIQHIIIVIQENRSFDNIFAGYPGANAPTFGTEHDGTVLPLRPITFSADPVYNAYTMPDGRADYDGGKMDAFDTITNGYSQKVGSGAYAYLQRTLVTPYWQMARNYVVADHMFQTEWGASFTAHLDLVSGSSLLSAGLAEADSPTNLPWGCDAPTGTVTNTWNSKGVYGPGKGPFPCFDESNSLFGDASIANTLDAGRINWRYYAVSVADNEGWSAFDAFRPVRDGPDWANVVSPQTTILKDAVNSLAGVSWVTPDLADSDHGGSNSSTGPSWVAAVVNAVGKSKYWNSSAIVVLWDDWGGWYDNVPPPQLDFLGLGARVPCLIISPYARRNYVDHTQYEFGSVLKFVEQTFGLPSLGVTDARANGLMDAFDFTQPPRKFVPIQAPFPPSHFLSEKPSRRPPDDM